MCGITCIRVCVCVWEQSKVKQSSHAYLISWAVCSFYHTDIMSKRYSSHDVVKMQRVQYLLLILSEQGHEYGQWPLGMANGTVCYYLKVMSVCFFDGCGVHSITLCVRYVENATLPHQSGSKRFTLKFHNESERMFAARTVAYSPLSPLNASQRRGTPRGNEQKHLSLSCSARLSCDYFSLLFSSLATNNVKVERWNIQLIVWVNFKPIL